MGDKRTLLAFLIIGLILLLMPKYYELVGIAPPPPSDDSTPAEEQLEPAATDSPAGLTQAPEEAPREYAPTPAPVTAMEPEGRPQGAAGSLSASQGTPLDRAFQPRSIEVTTPLQHLVLSTAGGALTSVELLAYTVAEEIPVELLPRGGAGLVVVLQDEFGERVLDLGGVEFMPDRERVTVTEDGEQTLTLRADLGEGRYVSKRLTFHPHRYAVDVELAYDGFGDDTIAYLEWRGGIDVAERDTDLDPQAMRAMYYINESLEEIEGDEEEGLSDKGLVRWAGVRNKYFFAALIPHTDSQVRVELSGRPLVAEPFRDYHVRLGVQLQAGPGIHAWTLYAGPLDYERLSGYEMALERAMSLGLPIIRDISKILLVLFVAAHTYIPNYGVVIMVFAVVVKIIVYPLTHKSYESAAKMQGLQPKIAALKEKHKNDNQRLSQETMKLYREEGVNPLGGCLPLLLQMPIFIAMYQTFSNTIQLRHAPFALWITDLSRPDTLTIAEFDLHVLPLLMATAMFFQSRMTMKDPKQAAMVYVMPVVMVFIMWRFSSGLVLYWTCFNVLQIGQQYLTNYRKAQAEAAQTG
ncbi:membrane protein insertase YidC [Candidatus Latescibacterota bacterium]